MRLKPDVKIKKLQPQMLVALLVAEGIFRDNGIELVVTSGEDGTHKEGSFHYKGLAIDIRTPNTNLETIMRRLKDALPGFDVIYEETPSHIHIEFDPKY